MRIRCRNLTLLALSVALPGNVQSFSSTITGGRRIPRTIIQTTSATSIFSNPFSAFDKNQKKEPVEAFLDAVNRKDFTEAFGYVDGDVDYEDASFARAFQGRDEVERIFRLKSRFSSQEIIVDDLVINN